MASEDRYKGYRGQALDVLKNSGVGVWSDVEVEAVDAAGNVAYATNLVNGKYDE